MARKTRRRGKRVRATRRVRRIGRVRRSRGGSRRYKNEGGGPFPTLAELGSQVQNIGKELGDFRTEAVAKAQALRNRLTQPSAPTY